MVHRRFPLWLGALLLIAVLLGGCDDPTAATPTPIIPPTAAPAERVSPPTATAVPPPPTATPAPPTPTLETVLPPEEETPAAALPTGTPAAELEALTDASPSPTFPPNPPTVEALLEETFASMAALPGYYFTATISVNDFGRTKETTLDGAYVRPDRLHWTTQVDESRTEGIIIGPDYYVSADGQDWLQVPGAEQALAQYQLWTTLHDALAADLSPRDDPDSPLTRLYYSLDAAHLPLPAVSEPWRLIEAGVWIGREDHLLHRLDLAAQTANYLLEEHMYFSGFGAVLDIQPPADEDGTPTVEPTPDYETPVPEPTPYEGRTFNPFTVPGRGTRPLTN
jgi:hypothetical protein